jgi:hypothetical protein
VTREPLTDAYLAECEHRARRFSGCWDAGTSGSLAADVMRLLAEVRRLRQDLAVAVGILSDLKSMAFGEPLPSDDEDD